MKVPEEIIALVEGGVASWMATCDAAGVAEATRVRGSRVGESRETLTVFVPIAQSGLTIGNLGANRRVAIFYCDVTDYSAVQIKGAVTAIDPTDERDRALQSRHMQRFIDACATLGVPREIMERHAYWPSFALHVDVHEVFVQTPGPTAGRPWQTAR